MATLLRNPRYRLFLGAAGAANLGDGIGALAFPWVATLLTRDPAWIAFVAFAGRLPWLLLALPAGVITDRADRRRLIARADAARAALAVGVVAVAGASGLPGGAPAGGGAVLALAGIGFLFGAAEVIRDNAAQTALPAIVAPGELERANGQLWSVERVMGAFVGPPLAGVLIALAVPAPFVAQVAAFGAAAVCIWALPGMAPRRGVVRAMRVEAMEGLAWMGAHRQVLQLAAITGAGNFCGAMSMTVLVLLSQEAFGLSAAGHGVLLTAGAAGGVIGGIAMPAVAARLGAGRAVLAACALWPWPFLALALTGSPLVAGAALFVEVASGMLWNVVTVSWRQRLIPGALLGRVNSVYRLIAWGALPLGAAAAAGVMAVAEPMLGREAALRAPCWIGFAGACGILGYAAARLRLR